MDRRVLLPDTRYDVSSHTVHAYCPSSFSPYILFDNLWIWYRNNKYVSGKRYGPFHEDPNLLTVIWKTDALDIWPSCSNFNSSALSSAWEWRAPIFFSCDLHIRYEIVFRFLSAEIQTHRVLLNSQRDWPMVRVSIWKAKSRSSKM